MSTQTKSARKSTKKAARPAAAKTKSASRPARPALGKRIELKPRRSHAASPRSSSERTPRRKKAEDGRQVFLVDTRKLTFHPLLEETPTMSSVVEELRKVVKKARGSTLMDARKRLADREPEWLGFVADVKARGVQVPLEVVKKGTGWHVVDGRNRLAGAREAKQRQVPCMVTEEEPQRVILGSLLARRHVSKELLAYVALDCYPQFIGDGEKGRPDAERAEENRSNYGFGTLEELADYSGVSKSTLEKAARIHRLFQHDKRLRKKWEWRLYAGTSFQGILAGSAADKKGAANGKASDAASVRVRRFFQSIANRLSGDFEAIQEEGPEAIAKTRRDAMQALAQLDDEAFEWIQATVEERDEILAEIAEEEEGD